MEMTVYSHVPLITGIVNDRNGIGVQGTIRPLYTDATFIDDKGTPPHISLPTFWLTSFARFRA